MVKTAKGIGKNVPLLFIDNENAQSGLRFFLKCVAVHWPRSLIRRRSGLAGSKIGVNRSLSNTWAPRRIHVDGHAAWRSSPGAIGRRGCGT
jgi:hypothetical protein